MTGQNAPPPRMGTALTAYLKRYRENLLHFPPDRIISSMVDCCDYLLIESERLESGEL